MIAALVAASVVVVAACGGEDGSAESNDSRDPQAQPVPGTPEFGEGDFEQVPLFRGAEEAGDPAVEADVTSQSFTTDSGSPDQVMVFYDRELERDGWQVVDRPERLGAEGTHRGVWQKDDQQLVVSATEFSGSDESDDEAAGTGTIQFSLSLGPA